MRFRSCHFQSLHSLPVASGKKRCLNSCERSLTTKRWTAMRRKGGRDSRVPSITPFSAVLGVARSSSERGVLHWNAFRSWSADCPANLEGSQERRRSESCDSWCGRGGHGQVQRGAGPGGRVRTRPALCEEALSPGPDTVSGVPGEAGRLIPSHRRSGAIISCRAGAVISWRNRGPACRVQPVRDPEPRDSSVIVRDARPEDAPALAALVVENRSDSSPRAGDRASPGAHAFYRRIGYEPTSFRFRKDLPAG